MNQQPTTVKRVLISVSDKTGVVEFARELAKMQVDILSTGGTSQLLRAADIPVRDVSDFTGFPEMMDGRVKTLHPLVHGGILGLRDTHAEVSRAHGIQWIDLVVVNLYPFAATIKNPASTFDDAVENIDIGGPAMIRSAAKNMGWVGVIVDPLDYTKVLTELQTHHALLPGTRKALAAKAFGHTADYDAMIYGYLDKKVEPSVSGFPAQLNLHLEKYADLRYGENPHQAASAYHFAENTAGILSAKQHQGKQLSYNNIADADAAVLCVNEFSAPACVIVKHANPCGAATAGTIDEAFQRALAADKISAFGGIVALNRPCTSQIAEMLGAIFVEVLIAPAYTDDALAVLAAKPNVRVLELRAAGLAGSKRELKFIEGGLLIQDSDVEVIDKSSLQVVTTLQPSDQDVDGMLFAWRVLKHIKSNAILLAKADATVGIGAGQVSRIDAVDIALRKAGDNLKDAVLASDAFFPFRDSIDKIAKTGIRAVIQPGGSIKDAEVIQACNEYGIAMVFTGKRCFKH
jgi:phosphoribosylaminoimidazolecarboxamide formyltransferase/IMP cyclohydrolase